MKKKQEMLQEIEQRFQEEKARVEQIYAAIPHLDEIGERLLTSYPDRLNVSTQYFWGGSMSLTLRDLSAFNTGELVDFLALVEELFDVEFHEGVDEPENNCKYFHTRVKPAGGNFDIYVRGYLKPENAECYRIVIGEKVEELVNRTPIYKFVCPGESA